MLCPKKYQIKEIQKRLPEDIKFFDETKFEKPEIETNDISVNVEELIHPNIFAAFVGSKIVS